MGRDRGPDVAVVGGGISGLVAARELARAGASVVLLEADDRLGGRIRAESLAGVRVDVGADSFATRGGGVASLLGELGLAEEIRSPEPLGAWAVLPGDADGPSRRAARAAPPSRRARAVRLPGAGALGIPAAPLSQAGRRALGTVGALRAAIEPMLPRSVGRDAATLAELVRSRLGARVLDRLVRPVALGVYSADPRHISITDPHSMNPAVRQLLEALASRGSLIAAATAVRDGAASAGAAAAGLRDGMISLVKALVAELERLGVELRTRSVAESLQPVGPGWRVSASRPRRATGDRGAENGAGDDVREIIEVGAVILAVPEHAAVPLLASCVDDRAVAPRPAPEQVEIVALAIHAPALDDAPRGTGALVPHESEVTAPIRAKALTHVTAKWPDRARERAPGLHVLRLSYGRTGTPPETAALGDAAVRELALRDASLILGVELRPEDVRDCIRREWRMGRLGAAPPSPPPGIHLAGDCVHGVGLASVVPGARAAAAAALRAALGTSHPSTLEGSPRP